ncbi:MAG: molybdate ABC transporter substrate-binding protein [Candidatus Eisenbacteria bacterium]
MTVTVVALSAQARTRLVVAAASSLTEVVGEFEAHYETLHPEVDVTPAFAGSGVHRVQIDRGAPIDVLVFASRGQVDPLVESGRVRRGDLVVVAENQLVLVCRAETALAGLEDLRSRPGLLIAAGDPVRVPAGEYAARLFEHRGWSPALEGRLVPAENVRQVLRYVETGVVAAGLVYRTDALRADDVVVAESYGPDDVGAVEVVAAPLLRSDHAALAADFVTFLLRPESAEIWTGHGFALPARSSADEAHR